MKEFLPRRVILLQLCLWMLCPALAWAQLPSLPSSSPSYTVLLTGRWAPGQSSAAPLPLLQEQLKSAGKNSAVVFMGNPFQPATLPGVSAGNRKELEAQLQKQLNYLQGYAGKIILMPGEHDAKGGLDQGVRNQERYISQYLQNEKLLLPENYCPGPAEVALTDDVHLLLLDTQWLLPNRRMDDEETQRGCPTTGGTATLAALDDVMRSNEEKNLLVAMSVSPEMSGLEYRLMHRQLSQMYAQHKGLVHAEGNSAALTHSTQDSIHYVTAGGGMKKGKSPRQAAPLFSQTAPGFAKVLYFPNGETWLEIWTAQDAQSNQGQVAHRVLLSRKPTQKQIEEQTKKMNLSFAGKKSALPASQVYKASGFREWLLGENYRPEWQTPVSLPVFDIGTQNGGLKVVQRGGGFQTVSLRLEDSTGRQYALRSVEKYPDAALPRILRHTLAADVVKDQISASHPYGSLVVPTLADAVGVYHTNPQYFIIPDDPRFGKYLKGFANTIGLFEERPDEDMSDLESFGNAKNVVGTDKVLENTLEDQNDQVDQRSLLRARLLDFFIADWDRHDDQWRWAEFKKEGKGKIYKPIPRDRDQAFFVNQGVIPNIASRRWILPKVQGFDESLRDIKGFNFNNRYFDRYFLTALERADWIAMADSVKAGLTDEAIDKAVRALPPEIQKISGERLASTLKARRAYIKRDAEEYYEFLAHKVDVVGTDLDERFEVQREAGGATLVTIYKKDGTSADDQLYRRRFLPDETREIRLYGLGGADEFQVQGQAADGIRVRIIGGDGMDKVTDSSSVVGLRRLTYVYDNPGGAQLALGPEARNLTRLRKTPVYDRRSFVYNYFGPLGSVEFNRDDGLLLGGGVLLKTQGFNKQPYGMMQRLVGSYALNTKSFLVDYAAHFPRLRMGMDVKVNVNWKSPGFAENFFGLGNETPFDPDLDIDLYRFQSSQLYTNVLVGGKIGKYESVFVGPAYQNVNVDRMDERFLPQQLAGTEQAIGFADPKSYAGARFEYTLDSRDLAALPSKGVHWLVAADVLKGVNESASDVARVHSQFSIYKTLRIPLKLTLATRFGGGHTFGDSYEFFQAQFLDGPSTLRGYRRNRFSGQSSLYNNTEARLRLFSFTTYLFPASLGVFGFHDMGRVWVKDEDSDKWHRGYGGGVWISPLNQVVLSLGYATSPEQSQLLLRAGFQF
ncbi:BamA/TamA family outer membrane protein [Rufibacter sediminis]|uniref:BamA/TamA family outer membrane protein n=1 Tax=Rufibacter sediminis TaxID=2762756 RepID=A0ABR6VTI1_9BACT|nr:BamA/TamA family outer membrane protein [Rufibacter sediminis]MBC3540511.1 BamA/TamA family outer membrane protein [Rufibacter sediminis]